MKIILNIFLHFEIAFFPFSVFQPTTVFDLNCVSLFLQHHADRDCFTSMHAQSTGLIHVHCIYNDLRQDTCMFSRTMQYVTITLYRMSMTEVKIDVVISLIYC